MKASKQRSVVGRLARAALRLCVFGVLAKALAAQCTPATQVPNGNHTAGDHSQVDNIALAASAFTLSQGASATFIAGNCIYLQSGFRANAVGATVPTTFQTWVESTPTAVSVSPSNQTGLSQTFTWTVSNPVGVARLSHVDMMFNLGSEDAVNSCFIHYNRAANLLYLTNNAGGDLQVGFAPGSAGSSSNSQCSITGVGASVSTVGTQLSIQVPVTFNASTFAGQKHQRLKAHDVSGLSSGWQSLGLWTIPLPPPAPDFILSAVPQAYYTAPNVQSTPSFVLNVTPLNGFNSSVSFSNTPPIPTCTQVVATPQASSPSWTATMSLVCGVLSSATYSTIVTATGGGISRQITLTLSVTLTPQWYLSTAVLPLGGGSISPASGLFLQGAEVDIIATPNSGYAFSSFTGNMHSVIGSTARVTMNGPSAVTANFSPLTSAATPSFSPAPGSYSSPQNVTMTTATGGASIYYTVGGAVPTPLNWTLYSNPVTIASPSTIQAIAVKAGMGDSLVAAGDYIITSAAPTPSFSPAAGTYSGPQSVTITAPGAMIRYTVNDPDPDPTPTTGTVYTEPVAISGNGTKTIRAIAYQSGMMNSPVSAAAYVIAPAAPTPTFSPAAGTYSGPQSVTITAPGAMIRYTVNDPDPDPTPTTGTVYTEPVAISGNGTKTIRAIAYQSGMANSPVTAAAYVITSTAPTPSFSPSAGNYSGPQSVTITAPGAMIRYTVNDADPDPTPTAGTIYTGPVEISGSGAKTIRAIAYQTGMANSPVTPAVYVIQSPAGTKREFIWMGGRMIAIETIP